MKRLAVAALLVLAACSPQPAPSQPPSSPPPVAAVVVNPQAEAAAPLTPVDHSQGAQSCPDCDTPNGGPVTLNQATIEQASIAVTGLGGPPIRYAPTTVVPNGVQPRFTSAQADAVGLAQVKNPTQDWTNTCEGFAGSAVWGFSSSGWASAKDHVNGTPDIYKHVIANPNGAVAGQMLGWAAGTYGHMTLAIGGGKLLTTDFVRQGMVDVAPIQQVADAWFGGQMPTALDPGYFPYAFGDNGIKAPKVAPASTVPKLDAVNVRRAFVTGKPAYGVVVIKRALAVPNKSPIAGGLVKARYRQFERSQGLPADGIPDRRSLNRLALSSNLFTLAA